MRHGKKVSDNKFTAWRDVDLSKRGELEASFAGQMLHKHNFKFDHAFTSLLKRAIKTYNIVSYEADRAWIPIEKSWRLNERHYGKLQGLCKNETTKIYGENEVFTWRRSFKKVPPSMPDSDPGHAKFDEKYANLPPSALPNGESLQQAQQRVLPYWHDTIMPKVQQGKNVVIVAHGNSLRAIIKQLTGMNSTQI
jgi:2,3-bisphosphoglycerate-dependent phosphoglycerate mutase